MPKDVGAATEKAGNRVPSVHPSSERERATTVNGDSPGLHMSGPLKASLVTTAGVVWTLNAWGRIDESAPHPLIMAANVVAMVVVFILIGRWVKRIVPESRPRGGFIVYLIAIIQLVTAVGLATFLSANTGAAPEQVRLALASGLAPIVVCVMLSVVYLFVNLSIRTRENWPVQLLAIRPLVWSVIVLSAYLLLIGPAMSSRT